MDRDSALAHVIAGLVLTGAAVIAIGSSAGALAQAADSAASAVSAEAGTAAPVQARRRGRDGRRDAEPAPPEPAAAPESLPTHTAAVAVQPDETVEAKLICKNIKATGTRVSRRICGTPEQWASVSQRTTDDAQETMRQIRDRTSIVVSQPENPLAPGGN